MRPPQAVSTFFSTSVYTFLTIFLSILFSVCLALLSCLSAFIFPSLACLQLPLSTFVYIFLYLHSFTFIYTFFFLCLHISVYLRPHAPLLTSACIFSTCICIHVPLDNFTCLSTCVYTFLCLPASPSIFLRSAFH